MNLVPQYHKSGLSLLVCQKSLLFFLSLRITYNWNTPIHSFQNFLYFWVCWHLDLIILVVFSNPNDSMILENIYPQITSSWLFEENGRHKVLITITITEVHLCIDILNKSTSECFNFFYIICVRTLSCAICNLILEPTSSKRV